MDVAQLVLTAGLALGLVVAAVVLHRRIGQVGDELGWARADLLRLVDEVRRELCAVRERLDDPAEP